MEIAICDTSSLIKLVKGGALNVLGRLFDKIYLPQGVKEECLDDQLSEGIKKPFFEIHTVRNILPVGMGKGERLVISLAVERHVETIITDDIKALRKSLEFNLYPLTTEDILVLGKRAGIIHSVKFILDQMRLKGEGIEDDLYLNILRAVDEDDTE